MTPDERAGACFDIDDIRNTDMRMVPADLEQRIADAIRAAEEELGKVAEKSIADAVALERERCAQVAEETFNEERLYEGVRNGDNILAAAIRATGNVAGGET